MSKVDKFPKRHWIMFLLCLPGNILGWFVLVILWLFSGEMIYWQNGLWVTISQKSWLGRSVFKNFNGGCICHGGWLKTELIYGKSINTRLEYHEHLHVEQYEVVNLYTVIFVLAGLFFFGNWAWLLLGLWAGCWWLFVLCAGVVAWLRGEPYYRGNILEESAYSQDEGYDE